MLDDNIVGNAKTPLPHREVFEAFSLRRTNEGPALRIFTPNMSGNYTALLVLNESEPPATVRYLRQVIQAIILQSGRTVHRIAVKRHRPENPENTGGPYKVELDRNSMHTGKIEPSLDKQFPLKAEKVYVAQIMDITDPTYPYIMAVNAESGILRGHIRIPRNPPKGIIRAQMKEIGDRIVRELQVGDRIFVRRITEREERYNGEDAPINGFEYRFEPAITLTAQDIARTFGKNTGLETRIDNFEKGSTIRDIALMRTQNLPGSIGKAGVGYVRTDYGFRKIVLPGVDLSTLLVIEARIHASNERLIVAEPTVLS